MDYINELIALMISLQEPATETTKTAAQSGACPGQLQNRAQTPNHNWQNTYWSQNSCKQTSYTILVHISLYVLAK